MEIKFSDRDIAVVKQRCAVYKTEALRGVWGAKTRIVIDVSDDKSTYGNLWSNLWVWTSPSSITEHDLQYLKVGSLLRLATIWQEGTGFVVEWSLIEDPESEEVRAQLKNAIAEVFG